MCLLVKLSFIKGVKISFTSILRRSTSSKCSQYEKCSVEFLNKRGLLRVHGSDASTFLQGLITNDIKHLHDGAQSMYTMFLNSRGRVLCDALIYKDNDHSFLIESDKEMFPALQKHLKIYRVRKKIDIEVDKNYGIWVTYPKRSFQSGSGGMTGLSLEAIQNEVKRSLLDCDNVIQNCKEKCKIICRDPRLAELGYRLIVPITEDLQSGKQIDSNESNNISYKMLRYKLGVGEGISELPPGKCFPLELNCDFLHGVSFHKGCYIGQELTARVYHTGVIRKRLMPITFESKPTESFVMDAVIENAMNKTSVGKLRGLEKRYGLGLLKINEALSSPALSILNMTASTFKPNWWPQEAPKERSMVGKDVG